MNNIMNATDLLFGRIAVRMNYISQEQLKECIGMQQQSSTAHDLPRVCQAMGALSADQINEIKREQSRIMNQNNNAVDSSAAPPRRRPASRAQTRIPVAPQAAENRLQQAQPHARSQSPAPRHSAKQVQPAPVRQASPKAQPANRGIALQTKHGGENEIDKYLRRMVEIGASDLHLSAGAPALVRNSGSMAPLFDNTILEPSSLRKMLEEISSSRAKEQFDNTNDADFAYRIEGVARFRANYFMDNKGMSAVFRVIPFEILTPEKIGLPEKVLDLCWLSKGMVLVTGPTGSGKSTTLASMIDFVNSNRDDHIITIEDPIEFVHSNKRCLINQRQIGTHTKSFKSALRAALREDPDIVLVGEMRDLETVHIALETAETGHLVFGTLHTTSAPSTVDRIIDQFPADRQAQIRTMLSESLCAVIAQVLCKKIGGGRVAAYEILFVNPAVSNLIREGKTHQIVSIMQTNKGLGMQTLNDHLTQLVKQGLVEPKEAFMKSNDKKTLKTAFEKAGIRFSL